MSEKEKYVAEIQELERIIQNLRKQLDRAVTRRTELVGVVKYLTEREKASGGEEKQQDQQQ